MNRAPDSWIALIRSIHWYHFQQVFMHFRVYSKTNSNNYKSSIETTTQTNKNRPIIRHSILRNNWLELIRVAPSFAIALLIRSPHFLNKNRYDLTIICWTIECFIPSTIISYRSTGYATNHSADSKNRNSNWPKNISSVIYLLVLVL